MCRKTYDYKFFKIVDMGSFTVAYQLLTVHRGSKVNYHKRSCYIDSQKIYWCGSGPEPENEDVYLELWKKGERLVRC